MRELSPIGWAIRPLQKYADFSGRAPRAEFWWYRLATGLAGFVAGMLDRLVFQGPAYGKLGILGGIVTVALVLPNVAVLVRRLHDAGRSAWWALIQVPMYGMIALGRSPFEFGAVLKTLPIVVGLVAALSLLGVVIAVLVFIIMPGTQGPNRYGPDPYGPDALEEVFA